VTMSDELIPSESESLPYTTPNGDVLVEGIEKPNQPGRRKKKPK